MTTKSKPNASIETVTTTAHAAHTPHNKKEKTMPAKTTHKPAASTTHPKKEKKTVKKTMPATLPTTATMTTTPVATTTPIATSPIGNTPGPSAQPTVFLTAPPRDACSPTPPPGFERPQGVNYRGSLPRGAELAAATTALQDLARFTPTYAATLGSTAPPLDHFIEALTVASGWTSLRAESSAWDAYCITQEGMAWQAFRPLLDKLVAAFKLAVDSNKALLSEYPGLATLLGAKAQIAQKAASTRRLNNKAVAEGKLPYHGLVGKKRQRQAEKAAVAQTSQSSGVATAPAQPAPAAAAVVPAAAVPAVNRGS